MPVESIRWVDNKAYVALYDKARAESKAEAWEWREIEIGLSDPGFAEVVKGLNPGDYVIARPAGLPAPRPERIAKSPGSVASREGGQRSSGRCPVPSRESNESPIRDRGSPSVAAGVRST